MEYALWYTTVLVGKDQATFENGLRAYQIFSLTVPSITELWTLIPTVISATGVLTPAFQTLDQKTEIDPDTPEESRPETIKGDIQTLDGKTDIELDTPVATQPDTIKTV